MAEERLEESDYKHACTEATKYLTMWILTATQMEPPPSAGLEKYRLNEQQARVPSDITLKHRYKILYEESFKGRWVDETKYTEIIDPQQAASPSKPSQSSVWGQKIGSKTRFGLTDSQKELSPPDVPDTAYALIEKRLSEDKEVLARAPYTLTCAGITDTAEVNELLDEFLKNGIVDEQGKLNRKMMPLLQSAISILSDAITYYENNAHDKKPEKDATAPDYAAQYTTMHQALRLRLHMLGAELEEWVKKNHEVSIATKPAGGYYNGSGLLTASNMAQDLTGNQQEVTTEYNLKNRMYSDNKPFRDERVKIDDMVAARLKRFDTISYCFDAGYFWYMQSRIPEKKASNTPRQPHREELTTQEKALYAYCGVVTRIGRAFGMWHQVMNDAGEFSKDFIKKGPARGQDIINGQMTCVLTELFRVGNSTDLEFLSGLMGRHETPLSDEEVKTIQAMIRKYDVYREVDKWRETLNAEAERLIGFLKTQKDIPSGIAERLEEFREEIFSPKQKKLSRIQNERLFFDDDDKPHRAAINKALKLSMKNGNQRYAIERFADACKELENKKEALDYFNAQFSKLMEYDATIDVNTYPYTTAAREKKPPLGEFIRYFAERFPRPDRPMHDGNWKPLPPPHKNSVEMQAYREAQKAYFSTIRAYIDAGRFGDPDAPENRALVKEVRRLSTGQYLPPLPGQEKAQLSK